MKDSIIIKPEDIDSVSIETDKIFVQYTTHIFLKPINNYVPIKRGQMTSFGIVYTHNGTAVHIMNR